MQPTSWATEMSMQNQDRPLEPDLTHLFVESGTTPELALAQSSNPNTRCSDNTADEIEPSGPRIVVHVPRGTVATAAPSPQRIPHDYLRVHSSDESLSSTHGSLDLEGSTRPQSAYEPIPSNVTCTLRMTFDGSIVPSLNLEVPYHEADSYQVIEKTAQEYVKNTCVETLHGKNLTFKYGFCAIIGGNVERCGVPLTSQEEWSDVCTILTNYWISDPQRTLHVDIIREYCSYRSRATSDVSFAATKRSEIQALMNRASDGRRYIPRTALMRFTSLETIREIIIQDPRLHMELKEKEEFIQTVQQNASCLLAMCVYAGLKMECLKKLLENGCSDMTFPLEYRHCCHPGCETDFENMMVDKQGSFMAARFDNIGQHQDFDKNVVIPLHYQPVDVDEEAFMTAGRKREYEEEEQSGTYRERESSKGKAYCGSGAYSNVYRVRIDPDHHRLSKNKHIDFALKEFKDRPQRGDADFKKELKVLERLREYRHKHIVTHLATWTQDGKYYMLFPYAQCNLRQYMKWTQFGAPTTENIIWLLRQIRDLAKALKNIHNLSANGLSKPASSPPSNLAAPRPQMQESGWHHDLKPENILLYKSPGRKRGNLQISDFGSSKIHTYRSGSINTRSPNGTLTYEPPEAKSENATSRPYDIWSLGCVFLELLIWAVLGFRSVSEFASKRVGRRYPGSQTDIVKDDAFWQMAEDGNITIRKSVLDWIQSLNEQVLRQRQQPFKEVLELIRRMLNPNRQDRILALDLWNTLDNIYKQKRLDLQNTMDETSPEGDNDGNSSFLPRLSLDPVDRHDPDDSRGIATSYRPNAGYVSENYLTASPIDTRIQRRYSSGSVISPSSASPLSRNYSLASSNMSTHGQRGSVDSHEDHIDESR